MEERKRKVPMDGWILGSGRGRGTAGGLVCVCSGGAALVRSSLEESRINTAEMYCIGSSQSVADDRKKTILNKLLSLRRGAKPKVITIHHNNS